MACSVLLCGCERALLARSVARLLVVYLFDVDEFPAHLVAAQVRVWHTRPSCDFDFGFDCHAVVEMLHLCVCSAVCFPRDLYVHVVAAVWREVYGRFSVVVPGFYQCAFQCLFHRLVLLLGRSGWILPYMSVRSCTLHPSWYARAIARIARTTALVALHAALAALFMLIHSLPFGFVVSSGAGFRSLSVLLTNIILYICVSVKFSLLFFRFFLSFSHFFRFFWCLGAFFSDS